MVRIRQGMAGEKYDPPYTRHQWHFVNTGALFGAWCRGVQFNAGVFFETQVTSGQKEDFAVPFVVGG